MSNFWVIEVEVGVQILGSSASVLEMSNLSFFYNKIETSCFRALYNYTQNINPAQNLGFTGMKSVYLWLLGGINGSDFGTYM